MRVKTEPVAEPSETYAVGEVAKLAGVTVRTLHHYDEIGLLRPGGRTRGGYRQYAESDLDRLQQILFYRELGFSLDAIATVLDDPDADLHVHLPRQRELLAGKLERLRALLELIDRTIEARRFGEPLTASERLEIFGNWEPPAGYAEKQRQYVDTDAWKRMAAEKADWTKDDWLRLSEERKDYARRLAAAIDAGLRPDSEEAKALAREHLKVLPHEWAREIVDGYVTQPETFGFSVRPDEQRPGMAEWLRDAVVHVLEKNGAPPAR